MSHLKVLRLVVVLLAVVVYLCGEQGWIANGLLADEAHRGVAFYLNGAVILLTIFCVPLAYVLRGRRSGWQVRGIWALQVVSILGGIVAYYLTMSTGGLLCAAIVLIMFFYTTAGGKRE